MHVSVFRNGRRHEEPIKGERDDAIVYIAVARIAELKAPFQKVDIRDRLLVWRWSRCQH